MNKASFLSNTRKGRNRHSTLRRTLSKVNCLSDLKKTYIGEVVDVICKLIPNTVFQQKIVVRPEVPILNRRPDFVISIPDKALILLEYKTTDQIIRIRREYITQTSDTLRKFRCSFQNENNSTISMKLISLLLVRNSSKRLNKVFCLSVEDIGRRRFYL